MKKNYTSPLAVEVNVEAESMLATQTSLAFARLHVTFRRWRGITFCNEQAHRIVILNTATVENRE